MASMVASNILTRADLDALPDDNLRHELIDGQFVMTPGTGVRPPDHGWCPRPSTMAGAVVPT